MSLHIPTKQFKDGFEIPVYGLGTWQMGGGMEADTSNDQAYVRAIRAAINWGVTHIDVAESYGAGHTEELVGEAIRGFDRSKLMLTSKVWSSNQGYDDLIAACEASLKRLGTDYLDLYLLHSYPEPGIDIAQTMKAMDYLVESEKVKNIGVCNMSVDQLKEVQSCVKHPIVCNQVHYSLAYREIVSSGVLDYCQKNSIAIIAWGPLQTGMLVHTDMLKRLSAKYNKTPYQIALNWLIYQTGVVTIAKTSNVKHLDENVGAIGWQLKPADVDGLTENYSSSFAYSKTSSHNRGAGS